MTIKPAFLIYLLQVHMILEVFDQFCVCVCVFLHNLLFCLQLFTNLDWYILDNSVYGTNAHNVKLACGVQKSLKPFK